MSAPCGIARCRARLPVSGIAWTCLLVLGCSASAVPASDRPRDAAAGGNAATPTRSTSAWAYPSDAQGIASSARPVDQSCRAESCEGQLPATAVADLKQTAALTEDCYARALKEDVELEGKVTLLLRLLEEPRGASVCQVTVDVTTFTLPASFESCLREVLSRTTARPIQGCVDVALPLSFVRKSVEGAGGVGGVGAGGASANGGVGAVAITSAGAAAVTR